MYWQIAAQVQILQQSQNSFVALHIKIERFVYSVYHSDSDGLFHVERFDVRAYFSDVKQQGVQMDVSRFYGLAFQLESFHLKWLSFVQRHLQ